MDIRMIEDRLRQYKPDSKLEELNALKEIAQEITLLALSRAEFFKQAAFQGGTCLRIVYGLPRFSEDLDFILFTPDTSFAWQRYLQEIQLEFESFGLTLEVKDRSQANSAVKKAFIKENSFGKILQLAYARNRSDVQVIQIKLEVDTNPPMGSDFETKLVDFPTPFSITTQKEPSLFAGKLHALLCREYVKGRDWFDFVWYVARKTPFNPKFLLQALFQQGPWARKNIKISLEWVKEQLQKKVRSIDWRSASKDVEILLKPRELQSLSYWNAGFFEHYIERLEIFQKKDNNLGS
jgi:predicted nucleotidyltransferase component of viral defense system